MYTSVSKLKQLFQHIYIIALLGTFFCSAQERLYFEKLSTEKDISQSITYAIEQDSLGNLWIASEEGIIRYNSKQSINYNKYHGLPKNVGNRVSTVFIDSKNRIWAGMETGVSLYNPSMDRFDYVGTNATTGPNLIKLIYEDHEGQIWVGAYNGLWMLNTSEKTYYFQKMANKVNIDALWDDGGKLFVGASDGLYMYNKEKKLIEDLGPNFHSMNILSLYKDKDVLLIGTKTKGLLKATGAIQNLDNVPLKNAKNFPIRDIARANKDGFYIATDGGGIYRLNNDYKVVGHYIQDDDDATSLSSNGVYDLCIGKEGIVWIATYGGGINIINPNKTVFQQITHRINDPNSIKNNFTRAISKDARGRIWFGTKKGISVWDRTTNTWEHIEKPNDIIMSLQSDGNYMWVGTYNSGAYKMDIKNFVSEHYDSHGKNPIPLNKIYALFKDSKNNVWLGGIEGNLTMIGSDGQIKSYPVSNVKSIIESNNGDILAGGRDGVHIINHNQEKALPIKELNANKEQLNYFNVNALLEIPNGQLIVSTNGAGILFFDARQKKIKTLNMASGLPSDIIQGAILYKENDLWASTARGLVNIKMDQKDTLIKVFDKKDGVTSTEFNYGSFAQLDEKTLAFGGLDGVTVFRPEDIGHIDISPQVEFESFSLFNKKLKPGEGPLVKHINTLEKLKLKHEENSITLQFVGVLQSAPSQVKYTWKLEGLDKSWSPPSEQNSVNFTNLDPGKYLFKVKASNRDGVWGPERHLEINVESPWWATATAYWIYFIACMLVLLAVVSITRFIVNKRRAEEQISFFNNITHEIRTPLTILLSSLEENTGVEKKEKGVKKIKTTVKRLNSLFEQLLNFQKVISKDGEFNDVSKIDINNYMSGVVDDFKPLLKEKNLTVDLQNKLSEKYFYYDKEELNKIVLNLVSNSIKYSNENGKIAIELLPTKKEHLMVRVIDDGIGIPKDQQKNILKRFYRARNVVNSQQPGVGLGLMIVKNLVEKRKGTISFQSEEGKGTVFNIVLKDQIENYDEHEIDSRTLPDNPVFLDQSIQAQEFSDSKILVVEDNDELRSILVQTLSVYFQIYEAKNGKEGIEMAGQLYPDMILTDLIMPEMDGMEMVKKLRDDINLNHIPVFMMTVLHSTAQKLESIEQGISDYIEKPINFNLLIAKIASLFSWQKRVQKKYIHETDVEDAALYRTKNDGDFITNLERYIIEKLMDSEFSVNDLCMKVGMSRTSLYMKLKSLVDLSPQDFIINTKLRYAKRQLVKGDSNIKEVAYRSGFSNPKYFSTSFKKFYGVTPSDFIQSLQKAK